jgi:multiple sugar transport system permease protein
MTETARVGPALVPTRRSWRAWLAHAAVRAALYGTLTAGACLVSLPFVWLLSSSLKDPGSIFLFPPEWLPDPVYLDNYAKAFTQMKFLQAFRNTAIIALGNVVGSCLAASMAAYAFAWLRFPGRDPFFLVLLSTLMLPATVTLIPQYLMFRGFGWLDSFLPLIVPTLFGGGAFYIFLIRQFMLRISREIADAARVDGCGYFDMYWRIMVPLVVPALLTVAALQFVGHWHEFLAPVIYLDSESKFTLTQQLDRFKSVFDAQWHLIMAGTVMQLVAPLALFFVLQRYFVQGLVFTGVKG